MTHSPSRILLSFLPLALLTAPVFGQKKPAQKTPPRTTPSPKPSTPARPSNKALLEALEAKDTIKALALVLKGANPNAGEEEGTVTALGFAAGLKDLKLVQALLERGARVNPQNTEVTPPLELALIEENEEIVKLLVEKGAKLNLGDGGLFGNRRPLVQAAYLGWLPTVTLMLDKGAEINHRDDDGVTALAGAAGGGHLAIMEFLIHRGASLPSDPLLLENALVGGSLPVLDFLLQNGYTLEASLRGNTPLHLAAAGGKPAMLQRLLERGASLEASNEENQTPLMVAVDGLKVEAIAYLLSKKARVDTLTPAYQSVLELLEEKEDSPEKEKIRKLLVDAGAKPTPPSLWRAAVRDEQELLKQLLDKGENPNTPDALKGVPLYYALTARGFLGESMPLVTALLAKGANPNASAPDGRLLIDVARDESDDSVVQLLRRYGAVQPELELTEAVERGDTAQIEAYLGKGVRPEPDALVHALSRKDQALFLRLLDKGAKLNAPLRIRSSLFGGAGDFVLHFTVMSGDIVATKLLLDRGADPNIRDDKKSGGVALEQLITDDEETADTLVRLLVEKGADVRATTKFNGGILATLVGRVGSKTLSYLLDKGAQADINPHAPNDKAPLFEAVEALKLENVRLLLERGARVEVKDSITEQTPLLILAERKLNVDGLAIAKLLLEHGADVNAKDRQGRTALRLAQEEGQAELVKLLSGAGGKSTVSPEFELSRAIWNNDLATVERLLRGGFPINKPLSGGFISKTPLTEASMYGSLPIVRLLVEKGADVNPSGSSPLYWAAGSGEPELVRYLLSKGAQIEGEEGALDTPLAYAAEEGDLEIMSLLLKAKADPNGRRAQPPGGGPLRKALIKGGEEAVDLLLKAGADPNLGAPMSVGLLLGGQALLERLVKAGASVNQKDQNGTTPLMGAAMLGQTETLTWLLQKKADPNLKDKNGKTALAYALERNKHECAKLLRKAGAKE